MEEDVKALSEEGAKVLLQQTKQFVDTKTQEITNNIESIKTDTQYIRFDRSDNLFRIGNITPNGIKLSFFRVNFNPNSSTTDSNENSLSINYPYRFKSSSNKEKSVSAIYVKKDIRFRSLPNQGESETLAVFNINKSYIKNDNEIYFNASSNKIQLSYTNGILLKTFKNNIVLNSFNSSKIRLTNN